MKRVPFAAVVALAVFPAVAQQNPWLDEVGYIITPNERAAWNGLSSSAQRQEFVDRFWRQRDPTPDTAVNEYRDEHYRRLDYVNQRFTTTASPGWRSDRGQVYIRFGPPDEIEAGTAVHPYQRWRYRWIDGVGADVIVEFVDRNVAGDYRMTMDPREKAALFAAPNWAAHAPALTPTLGEP